MQFDDDIMNVLTLKMKEMWVESITFIIILYVTLSLNIEMIDLEICG